MFGNINSPAIPVGTFILDEPTTYRRSYETASWYTLIEVPAGEYEITTNGYWAFIKLPGTIVDEHFVNRVFTASSVAPKRNIGKTDTHITQGYAYDLAKSFATDPEHFRLNDGWTLTARQWGGEDDSLSRGRRRVSFDLVPPAEAA